MIVSLLRVGALRWAARVRPRPDHRPGGFKAGRQHGKAGAVGGKALLDGGVKPHAECG
jgi:hypothetical protein